MARLPLVHDVLKPQRPALEAVFQPRRVAVIGATERVASVGRSVLWNLLSHPFGGTVYPVNPKRSSVLGIAAYPNIAAVPGPVDLAVIATPAPTVPAIIQQCVQAGVRAAIILSAGFREVGEEGAALERQILDHARGRMRLIGPNCLGVMRPVNGLNASFAAGSPRPGSVAFLSQSGALGTAILDWSFKEEVGFSAFVSTGSMLDVGWGDLIDYFGDDPSTHSIVLYMESIGDARSFLSAAREVALSKPIILLKAGTTEEAARAAISHTGALVGSDAVLQAACRRVGVLRVESIQDLFRMADVLGKQPRPKGPRLAILTNAGGPGVLATDTLVRSGGSLADLTPQSVEALDLALPPHWSRGNPVDLLGDAGPDRYAQALEIVLADPHCDGVLIILTPQAMSDPTATAEAIKSASAHVQKPVLASWMGGPAVELGHQLLTQSRIPTFGYPDVAARQFSYMWQYSYNLESIYETPQPVKEAESSAAAATADKIIQHALDQGRQLLTEVESKQLLHAYGIPVADTRSAATEDEAVEHANAVGYPVVLKVLSQTITHKARVGGVRLDLPDADAVRAAFRAIQASVARNADASQFQGVTVQPMLRVSEGHELIFGSSPDAQFGPVLLFGAGGRLVEVMQDRALGLPPLTTVLARHMMEQTRIYRVLREIDSHSAVDLHQLEALLVRFSQMVIELPRACEIDINPLLVGPDGAIALDARVVLYEAHVPTEQLPRPVIRPYPVQYVHPWRLANGTEVRIRPIRPEDEPQVVRFHEQLSEQSVYYRYFHIIGLSARTAHERLRRRCFIDYDREIALVAERAAPDAGEREILGIGRLIRTPGTRDAEFAVLIADRAQHQGLGTELVGRLIEVARAEGVGRIIASMIQENRVMQQICRKFGFRLEESEERMIDAELILSADPSA